METDRLAAETDPNEAVEVTPPSRARAVIGPAGALCAGVGVILLSLTIELPSVEGSVSPRWWPQLAGALMVLFALAALLRDSIKTPPVEEGLMPRQPEGLLRIVLTLAAIVVYGVLWHFFDFRVVTLLMVAALVAVGGGRGWKSLIVFPAIVTFVLWGLFSVMLRVPV